MIVGHKRVIDNLKDFYQKSNSKPQKLEIFNLVEKLIAAKTAFDLENISTKLDQLLDLIPGNADLLAAQTELLDATLETSLAEEYEKIITDKMTEVCQKAGKTTLEDYATVYLSTNRYIASEPSALAVFENFLSTFMAQHPDGTYMFILKLLSNKNISRFLSIKSLSEIIYGIRAEITYEIKSEFGEIDPHYMRRGEKHINKLLRNTCNPKTNKPYTLREIMCHSEVTDYIKKSSTLNNFMQRQRSYSAAVGFFKETNKHQESIPAQNIQHSNEP